MSRLFNEYFDRKFVINLDRSPDRWAHVQEQMRMHDLGGIERYSGYDFKDYVHLPNNLRQPMENAMCGCTASHGALLHEIGWHGWDKVLVLEDDFQVVHSDFHDKFEFLISQVPADWDMIYLGAHYADKPLGRVNANCVIADRIKTTSSYAIRGPYARFLAPFFFGTAGPDDLFSGFNALNKVYVMQPRLMIQAHLRSVIWDQDTNNGPCMMDTRHENMV